VALFQRAAEGFGRHVHSIGASQWHDPTPDTEWDVRMLVNHVTVEQLWVPPLVEGSSVADIGTRLDGDQLGDDPIATWDAAMAASLDAFGAPGVLDRRVSLASGEKAIADYCGEMTMDALIHSWDLARAVGGDETLDPELVGLAYEQLLPMADQLEGSGMFAPPVSVPADASPQTKLLAIVGRGA
jgi:uncharacterized protein (TIGR03086 family)